MIPFYGFAPYPMVQQPQPMEPRQLMAMPSQPPPEIQIKTGNTRRHRKRKEEKEEDISSIGTSSVPSRKRKKTHTVWLTAGGKRIPAKYRA